MDLVADDQKELAAKKRELENAILRNRIRVKESMRCEAPEICKACFELLKIAYSEISNFREELFLLNRKPE